MNKTKTIILALAILTSLTTGCQKQESTKQHTDRVIANVTESKTAFPYWLVFFAGHDGSKCNGCTMIGGKLIHKDCQGYGRQCSKASRVIFDQNGSQITATTVDTFDLTSEDFFAMPDRSLYFEDDNKDPFYLNIPEQLVYRDSTTLQFTFTGLYITSSPAYSND